MPLFEKCVDEETPVELPAHDAAGRGHGGLRRRRPDIARPSHLFLAAAMDKHGITPAQGLAAMTHGQSVIVAGLVLLRQRPSTAKGITFVTLEDETGVVNLIVRQQVWELYRRAARAAVVMVAHGELQRDGEVIHVLVKCIEDWSRQFADLNLRSRDFR